MKSGSQRILGHESRKTWILLGIVSIVLVSLLGLEWVRTTRGRSGTLRSHSSAQHHKVLLTWGASSSPGVAYNLYRSSSSDRRLLKLNPTPVQGLTYTDDTVDNGVTYTYVARAADALGNESPDSPQFVITIPPN
jgi:fibronectin type 3 domain-containing protein